MANVTREMAVKVTANASSLKAAMKDTRREVSETAVAIKSASKSGAKSFEEMVQAQIASRTRAMESAGNRASVKEEVNRRLFGEGYTGNKSPISAQIAAITNQARSANVEVGKLDGLMAKLLAGERGGMLTHLGTTLGVSAGTIIAAAGAFAADRVIRAGFDRIRAVNRGEMSGWEGATKGIFDPVSKIPVVGLPFQIGLGAVDDWNAKVAKASVRAKEMQTAYKGVWEQVDKVKTTMRELDVESGKSPYLAMLKQAEDLARTGEEHRKLANQLQDEAIKRLIQEQANVPTLGANFGSQFMNYMRNEAGPDLVRGSNAAADAYKKKMDELRASNELSYQAISGDFRRGAYERYDALAESPAMRIKKQIQEMKDLGIDVNDPSTYNRVLSGFADQLKEPYRPYSLPPLQTGAASLDLERAGYGPGGRPGGPDQLSQKQLDELKENNQTLKDIRADLQNSVVPIFAF